MNNHIIKLFANANETLIKVNKINHTYFIVGLVLMIILLVTAISLGLYFGLKYNKKKTQGLIFEYNIKKQIKDLASKNKIEYIEGGQFGYESKIFEVDAILLSPKILIVTEYKSYIGNISGDAASEMLYITDKKGKKNKIKNPILQNDKHISHMLSLLRQTNPLTISLIVFPKNTTFDIHNIPSHAILMSEDNLESDFAKLVEEINQLSDTINVSDLYANINCFRANTSAENRKFKKITKQK